MKVWTIFVVRTVVLQLFLPYNTMSFTVVLVVRSKTASHQRLILLSLLLMLWPGRAEVSATMLNVLLHLLLGVIKEVQVFRKDEDIQWCPYYPLDAILFFS